MCQCRPRSHQHQQPCSPVNELRQRRDHALRSLLKTTRLPRQPQRQHRTSPSSLRRVVVEVKLRAPTRSTLSRRQLQQPHPSNNQTVTTWAVQIRPASSRWPSVTRGASASKARAIHRLLAIETPRREPQLTLRPTRPSHLRNSEATTQQERKLFRATGSRPRSKPCSAWQG